VAFSRGGFIAHAASGVNRGDVTYKNNGTEKIDRSVPLRRLRCLRRLRRLREALDSFVGAAVERLFRLHHVFHLAIELHVLVAPLDDRRRRLVRRNLYVPIPPEPGAGRSVGASSRVSRPTPVPGPRLRRVRPSAADPYPPPFCATAPPPLDLNWSTVTSARSYPPAFLSRGGEKFLGSRLAHKGPRCVAPNWKPWSLGSG
jgi:hypothetical protein